MNDLMLFKNEVCNGSKVVAGFIEIVRQRVKETLPKLNGTDKKWEAIIGTELQNAMDKESNTTVVWDTEDLVNQVAATIYEDNIILNAILELKVDGIEIFWVGYYNQEEKLSYKETITG